MLAGAVDEDLHVDPGETHDVCGFLDGLLLGKSQPEGLEFPLRQGAPRAVPKLIGVIAAFGPIGR